MTTAVRTVATCLVGSGDGMGVRRAGIAIAMPEPCVARAGVVARDRVTVFAERTALGRLAFLLAVWRAFGFLAGRALERGLLFLLVRDAAAFNCFPFLGLTTPETSRHGPSAAPIPRL